MSFDKRSGDEGRARDVLAAEAFVLPARDPALHVEPPHDVLAAEEFELPGGDPALRPEPVRLPDDPTGIVEPHDILAAEEFAMPAGHRATGIRDGPATSRRAGRVIVGLVAIAAIAAAGRRRGRG